MYTTTDLKKLVARASQRIVEARETLAPIYALVEVFCGTREIYLGGGAGIAGLFGEPLAVPDYIWDLYCARPYQMAKELVDHLAASIAGDIAGTAGAASVCLKTFIRGQELSVTIGGVAYFRFHRYEIGRSAGSRKFPGWFSGAELKIIPVEFLLARVYQELYNPAACSEWPSLLALEARLFEQLPAEKKHTVSSLVSVGSLSATIGLLMNGILVSGGPGSTEIITDASPERIKQLLAGFWKAEKNRNQAGSAMIAAKSKSLGVPGDFRLARDEYWPARGSQHRVIVYNSTEYECVPAEDLSASENLPSGQASGPGPSELAAASPMVATAWVRLRFQALYGKVDVALREKLLASPAEQAFSMDFYFGTPENPAVSRKKLTAEDHFIPDYCPRG